MENGKVILPAAQPVSSGASGVSAPFSILPEKIVQQTEALGQAMLQFMAAPAGEHLEAAAAFSGKFEVMTQSLDRICLDVCSCAHSMTAAAGEALRNRIELGMRFMEDLAAAKSPADAIRLQLEFFTAQMQLLAESSKATQMGFARLFAALWNVPGPAPSISEPRG